LTSLERRLVVGTAAALLAVFGVLFWGSVSAVRSLGEAYVLARLEHDAEALVAAVRTDRRGAVRLREGRVTPIYQQPLSGHYFVLTLDDGSQVRSRSLWDETLDAPFVAAGQVTNYRGTGPRAQHLLLRTGGYEKGGLRFSLTVAEDLAPMAADIRRFQWFALGVLALALLSVVAIQRYLLRRGFRALDEVRDEVRQIADGASDALHQLGPAEIRPLTTEVNHLLRQLQRRLQRSRQALGNLAHALKGPLTRITRDIDALPLPLDERQQLGEQLQRIGGLIERQLKRARFAGEGATGRFNPARQLPDLLEALQQMHRARQLQISSGVLPDRTLPFDHDDMLELLGNLLDNACKWASRRVDLQISFGRALQITVADDGPGVPEAERRRLLRRGSRLDEQERGHGLGLAIVRDLVSDYAGQIELSQSAVLGGLEVGITLPLPRAPD
jgi:signal transduction histidine kinase